MGQLNRLLAATDLSAPARHAAERAALLARTSGAVLDLIHVSTPAPLAKLRQLISDIPPEVEQRLLDASREELQQLAATLQRHHGIAAGTCVVAGPLLEEIVRQATALQADLLVFGAHGAGFMRHLLLGSTAERMVSYSALPTLVVKQAAHEPYKTLLVPVDFSASSHRALANALSLAPQAEIILLHAASVPFEGKLRYAGVDDRTIHHYQVAAEAAALQKLQALRDSVGTTGERISLRAVHGDPSQHIIQLEQELDCDLIVVGKHGENPVEQLLLGSVTRHVLAESQCDVLVSR